MNDRDQLVPVVGQPRWLPVVLALPCAGLAWLTWPDARASADAVGIALTLAAALAVASAAVALHTATVVVVTVNAVLVTRPGYTVGATCALLAVMVLLGAHYTRRVVVAIAAVTGTVVIAVTIWVAPAVLDGNAGNLILAVLGALGAGDARRRRAATEAARLQQAQHTARQRERAAERAERRRIAREMHDVVAHQLSMIAVQAQTLPYTVPGLPDPARVQAAGIAAAARAALTEMRDLLTVLRDADDVAAHTPVPTLDDLPELLAATRRASSPVHAKVTADLPALPASLSRAAYRIVQEALTNARRHAPGQPIVVEVTAAPARLVVRVDNPVPTARTRSGPPSELGHGLLGLHERVHLLGGHLDIEHQSDRFVVTAELPLPIGERS